MDALTYSWRPARLDDVPALIDLSQRNFDLEVTDIFVLDFDASARNLSQAILNQHYQPLTEMVSVAVTHDQQLLAWTWARSTDLPPWSDQRMVQARMANVEMTLSARTRRQLVLDMLALWEGFARFAGVGIISSSSMRHDYESFMRLHEQNGYTVRGSNAYKLLTKE